MQVNEDFVSNASLPLMAAANLQDDLMMASNDLDRLQTLLAAAARARGRRGGAGPGVSGAFGARAVSEAASSERHEITKRDWPSPNRRASRRGG